jgi:flavodoxin
MRSPLNPEKKRLISFYSRRGLNYVSGRIVDLKVGNTEVVAQMIQKVAGGDLFRIETVADYPEGYEATTEVANEELRSNARPKLKGRVEDMGPYDVIFLGYPNWWGTMPMPVYTFLESYDLSGKTIIPSARTRAAGWAIAKARSPKRAPKPPCSRESPSLELGRAPQVPR